MKAQSSVILLGLLMSGCTPLSQASLVYSSAVTVGVSATVATPASPGVEVTIGYDQLDAAYVPVAVGRPCTVSGSQTCNENTHPLMPVQGTNNIDRSDKLNEAALDNAEQAVRVALSEQQRLQEQVLQLRQERTQSERALRESSVSEGQPEGGLEPGVEGAPAAAAASVQAGMLRSRIADATARIDQLQPSLDEAQRDVSRAVANRANLSAALAANIDNKVDAYSVFGSFDGATTVGAEGGGTAGTSASAGLDLGKVFSTGIASQNLTQGINQSATAVAMTQCLAAAERASSTSEEARRAAVREELSLACARTTASRR